MGLFAILREPEQPFSVVHCHLNLWVLGGLLGHRTFFFDLGLRLKADKGHAVSQFSVALPFEPYEGMSRDLYQEMQEQKNLYLIFGKQVRATQHAGTGYSIEYDGTPIRAFPVASVANVPLQPTTQARPHHLSLQRVELGRPIAVGSEGYVRYRFQAGRMGRAWSWKRFLLAKNGAVVDFRVADVREVLGLADSDALLERVVKIDNLFMFVIVPASFVVQSASPALHYMRLLEGRDWEPYLGRAAYFWPRSRKMVIHQWRKSEVTAEEPFRGFLSLGRAFGYEALGNHVVTAVVTVIVLVAIANLWDLTPSVSDTATAVLSAWKWLIGLLLTAGLLKVVGSAKLARDFGKKLRTWFLKAETRMMQIRKAE